jgi:hypothetical protein
MVQIVDHSYCTSAQVESVIGYAGAVTNVTAADITAAIKFASSEVDDITHSVFLSAEDSGTSSGTGTTTSLTDSTKSTSWTTDKWVNYVLWIYGGTGADQYSRIASNTTTVLTLTDAITIPDNTKPIPGGL